VVDFRDDTFYFFFYLFNVHYCFTFMRQHKKKFPSRKVGRSFVNCCKALTQSLYFSWKRGILHQQPFDDRQFLLSQSRTTPCEL
jgi:hypothetical protein